MRPDYGQKTAPFRQARQSDGLLIAIDGGATKTDLVLFQPNGTVLCRVTGGPSNSSEIGMARSLATLQDLIGHLLTGPEGQAPDLGMPLLAVHLGIAAGGVPANRVRYRAFLEQLLPGAKAISNDSDACSALNSGLKSGDGMVLIAGTGSAVFVRKDDIIHQIGGWGHLLSDEGSGYAIGRMALSRVLQALDGRRPATGLTQRMHEALGEPVNVAIATIYDGGKRLIASLAPVVFKAAEQGDQAAREILAETCGQLAELITAGSRLLATPPYRVVLAGGLWQASQGWLQRQLFDLLGPDYQPIRPSLPPVFGSAVTAMQTAGLSADAPFEEQFADSLQQLPSDQPISRRSAP